MADRVPTRQASLGQVRRTRMRITMTPATPAMNTVPHPSLESRPADGGEQNHERKRHSNTSDIQEVAKGIVGCRVERLLL